MIKLLNLSKLYIKYVYDLNTYLKNKIQEKLNLVSYIVGQLVDNRDPSLDRAQSSTLLHSLFSLKTHTNAHTYSSLTVTMLPNK